MKEVFFIVAMAVLSINCFAQNSERIPTKGYALYTADGDLKPYEFTRHEIGENDILIETLYATATFIRGATTGVHRPIHW